MSKTFKSVTQGNDHVLHAHPSGDQVRVAIEGERHSGSIISRDDATKFALQTLRAAGAHKDSQDYLGGAVEQLIFHIATAEREAAAEADRVKLESEALKLLLAFQAIDDPDNRGCEWRQYGSETKDKWLAVARAARELNKEAEQ